MKNRLILGLIFILFGTFFLLKDQISNYFSLFLLLLGIFFVVIYLITKTYGFLIPGSIFLGIGVGLFLEDKNPAYFLISFGLGFILIYILGFIYKKSPPWPLIPGAIFLGMGIYKILIYRGIIPKGFFEVVLPYWPVVLIIIGIYLILKKK